MKSLKLSKKKKEELDEPVKMDAPEYPWGSRLNLDSEQVAKFPELKDAQVDDVLIATVKLKVKSVRSDDRNEGGKTVHHHDVELQVTDMEFVPKEKKAPDASKLYGKDD